jgi:hypothetical protein
MGCGVRTCGGPQNTTTFSSLSGGQGIGPSALKPDSCGIMPTALQTATLYYASSTLSNLYHYRHILLRKLRGQSQLIGHGLHLERSRVLKYSKSRGLQDGLYIGTPESYMVRARYFLVTISYFLMSSCMATACLCTSPYLSVHSQKRFTRTCLPPDGTSRSRGI